MGSELGRNDTPSLKDTLFQLVKCDVPTCNDTVDAAMYFSDKRRTKYYCQYHYNWAAHLRNRGFYVISAFLSFIDSLPDRYTCDEAHFSVDAGGTPRFYPIPDPLGIIARRKLVFAKVKNPPENGSQEGTVA